MSTLIAENTAFLVNLILQFRPDIFIFLEQPKGTTMWHLPAFADAIEAAGIFGTIRARDSESHEVTFKFAEASPEFI